MASTDDPFTQVHDAIVELVKTNSILYGMVRPRSWITYDGSDRSPRPSETSEADKPEIELRADGGFFHHQRTSAGASVTKRWTWYVSCGDQRPSQELFPIEWELFRSLSQWSSLKSLTWSSEAFVKDFKAAECKDTLEDKGHVRSIPGWVGVVSCEVQMWFSTSVLVPS